MDTEIKGKIIKRRYDSLDELIAEVRDDPERMYRVDGCSPSESFHGVRSIAHALDLATDGWADELNAALTVAETAVTTVERDMPTAAFPLVYDVAGCEVDVSRYLAGTPENMIDYPLAEISKAGRVITLCASISASAAVSPDSIKRRGQTVTALALALSRLGYATEIYAEMTTTNGGYKCSIRTLVKEARDMIDPERLMYALAHPSMLRVLTFCSFWGLPELWVNRIGKHGIGAPCDPIKDLPEGTIYLPCVFSDHDVPDADRQLLKWLQELGIVTD